MRKSILTCFLVLFLGSFLFSDSENQEKKGLSLIKTKLSFLPSNENDDKTNERSKQKKEDSKNNASSKEKNQRYKKRLKNKKYKYLINSWEPYWVSSGEIEDEKFLFFQTNIGLGFLYFDQLRANIGASPSNLFRYSGSAPIKGRLRYNRTPLYEFLIGYQILPWVNASLSYQHQGGVTIFTRAIDGQDTNPGPGDIVRNPQNQFRSNFSIDAFMLKGSVEFPWPMIWKLTAFTPYLGAGVGMGWQSWVRPELDLAYNLERQNNVPPFRSYVGQQIFFKSKYCANFVWGLDAGIKIQNAIPTNHFAVKLGCKYNQWGQARNLGKSSNQGEINFGLLRPFRIKTVYSFAPYVALQWNIPSSSFAQAPDIIKGRSTDSWKPYFVDGGELQLPRAIFSQFTGGIGFLYFAGVRGDLTFGPNTNYNAYGQCPGKFSVNYNRTPVVEYIFGFRLSPWFKVGFSKQFHSSILIQTRTKQNINSEGPVFSQFQGNLNLISGGLKIYLEVPKPMIWKNLAYTFFISGTAGPCWQSWNRMGVVLKYTDLANLIGRNATHASFFPLRSKVVPNANFMADTGLKIKSARFDINFYMIAGCKYTYWGSARNLGKIDQQYPSFREGLINPISIKTIYSFFTLYRSAMGFWKCLSIHT